MILDHIGLAVRDFAKSATFFRRALAPLGIQTVLEGEGWAISTDGNRNSGSVRTTSRPGRSTSPSPPRTASRCAHSTAPRWRGSRDNGAPGTAPVPSGLRGAFVIDPTANVGWCATG